MKTERRHELNQNELAESVNTTLDQIMPYWQVLAGVVILAFTGYFLFAFVSSSRQKADELAWAALYDAKAGRNIDALDEIARTQSGSHVAVWAAQAAAQAKLAEASSAVHRDREESKKGFAEAIEGFQNVLKSSKLDLLSQRSTWGLGQAYEGSADLPRAKEAFQQIIDEWPDSALAEQAKARIARLNDPKTAEFYSWFFAQTPRPASSGQSESSRFSLDDLPEDPDFGVPAPPASGANSDSSTVAPAQNSDLEPAANDATQEALPVDE